MSRDTSRALSAGIEPARQLKNVRRLMPSAAMNASRPPSEAAARSSGFEGSDMGAIGAATMHHVSSIIPAPTSGHGSCTIRRMESAFLSERDYHIECGRRLRALIDALGMRQVEAAQIMGISKSHLGNFLRGDPIRVYALYRLCKVKGVGMDWVFNGDPSGLPHRVATELLRLGGEPEGREAAAHQEVETAASLPPIRERGANIA